MNDILFGNNNSKVITKLSKRYFKKNKVRNLAALLAIILTAFLFTSITSLAFNMASSIQLSLQMQKGCLLYTSRLAHGFAPCGILVFFEQRKYNKSCWRKTIWII